MKILSKRVRIAAALAAAAMFSLPALAHHGWSWTQDGFFELTGIITEIYIGNPHATLDVDVEGAIWRVELAPPARTMAAGFTDEVVKKGDEVTAIGNRSRDETERRMKAVRIMVNGKTYDVYPDRVPPS
ncbi:DUF6152 family protein [Pseudaminobacter sp. NGMCC 1.201702]|uniref:DUF6152 family protein n=1 Tax=Pseudaminobacter sp. NGMCC 1.201702 TaxID=3391825 RepID=UPI0039EE9534